MTRPDTYRSWTCPRCEFRFDNPIGLTAAVCPKAYHGTRREPVEMRPSQASKVVPGTTGYRGYHLAKSSGTTWVPPRESPGRRRGTMYPPKGGTGSQAQPVPPEYQGTP